MITFFADVRLLPTSMMAVVFDGISRRPDVRGVLYLIDLLNDITITLPIKFTLPASYIIVSNYNSGL